MTPYRSWRHPRPDVRIAARVLLIDNYDSFVWNLADYAASLGAQVRVVRNDEDIDAAVQDFSPTHLVLSPGPGRPDDSGATLRIAQDPPDLPILGVCLGHQALAQAAGGEVVVASEAVHGKADRVHHDAGGLLAKLPSPFKAARYHSLVVDPDRVPRAWRITARLEDGTVMAMQHADKPWFGVQFHPESIATEHGLDILAAFLSEGSS